MLTTFQITRNNAEGRVRNLIDRDRPIVQEETPRSLLPAVAGITFHSDTHAAFLMVSHLS